MGPRIVWRTAPDTSTEPGSLRAIAIPAILAAPWFKALIESFD